ncbi:hypothetical protein NitYY0826_C1448 [Nitratiruptor sp. YY08-26]|uniref:hypothetical protein n=1 Tax=unclassified Nitratiruptor TaxID=2624044 RepID=UPI001915C6D5|nr:MULTISPECIES: hypothetical protein [unclassified Nitratiruptor]BCD62570.1 hypothetical protein NitYY0813_C1446 [Nitratiruptor sp. YY08-13]BCD66506.1 hypothetical protein NitYY0826_C1448 [Nitratiruptor sp. YY08-26]
MDIEKLKQDREFLQNLEEQKRSALRSKDIVKMYDVLDTMLALDMEEENIDLLYQNILETAFDTLTQMLTEGQKFDFHKEFDEYVARAIYEHALERWDRGERKGAKELFLVLSFLVPQNYKDAMFLSLVATAKGMSLDEFLNNFVAKEKIEEESFFFDKFTDNAKKFLKENEKTLDEELKKAEKLA